MTTIALFSTKDDLDILKAQKDFTHFKLISLCIEGFVAAEEENIPCKTIEDYIDAVKVFNEGVKNLELTRKICNTLDKALTTKNPLSTHDLFWFFSHLVNNVYLANIFCNAVWKKEKPKKVVFIHPPSISLYQTLTDYSVNLKCIQEFFFHKHISCQGLESKVVPKKSPSTTWRAYLATQKFKFLNFLYRLKNFQKPGLFIAQHYDFETCVSLQQFYKVYWMRNLNFPRFKETNYQEHRKITFEKDIEQTLTHLLTFDEISYYNAVRDKLSFLLALVIPVLDLQASYFLQLFQKKKIKLAIAVSGQSLEVLSCIRAAYIHKIPMIWGQHGGLYGYGECPLMEDLNNAYTHYFLYTGKNNSLIIPQKSYFAVGDSKLLKIYHANRFL